MTAAKTEKKKPRKPFTHSPIGVLHKSQLSGTILNCYGEPKPIVGYKEYLRFTSPGFSHQREEQKAIEGFTAV